MIGARTFVPFHVTIRYDSDKDTVPVVAVAGEVDASTVSELRRAIIGRPSRAVRHVVARVESARRAASRTHRQPVSNPTRSPTTWWPME
jgi:hypothetical protein